MKTSKKVGNIHRVVIMCKVLSHMTQGEELKTRISFFLFYKINVASVERQVK